MFIFRHAGLLPDCFRGPFRLLIFLIFLAAAVFAPALPAQTVAVTLSAMPNPSVLGTAVTLTAQVGTHTGRVTFYDGSNVLGTRAVSNGAATLSTTLLASGTRSLRAHFQGDQGEPNGDSNVLVHAVQAAAANLFVPRVPLASGLAPSSAAAGDFNGDNKADLAVVNANANTISVFLGNGDGSFQAGVTYATGVQPRFIAAADFNQDGNTDFAVANNADTSVSILLGNGSGAFQPAVNYSVGYSGMALAAGDLNGDGKPDLVVATSYDVKVLLGNGDGTLQGAAGYSAGSVPSFVALADFDGDGVSDIAVANSGENTISILRGNGDGTLQPAVYWTVDSGPRSIAAADFNGDGNADLAVANFGSNDIAILLGNGDGTFQSGHVYLDGSGPESIAAADFNGDGTLDLIVASAGSGTVGVLAGNGDGTFQREVDYAAGTMPRFVVTGEFNGDGMTDAAIVDETGNQAIVLNGAAAAMTASGGTPQSTTAGTPFGAALSVTVTNGSGVALAGVTVTFTTPPTGAGATLSSSTATTDASGVASVTAAANGTLGSYTVTASAGPFSASFDLTNVLGGPASLTPSNTPQLTRVGDPFGKPLKVTVTDAGGNALAGVTVAFAAPVSGATATLSAPSAITDASGSASVIATANATMGAYVVTAYAGALNALFSLTNQAVSGISLQAPPASTFGVRATLTATVTPLAATGKVTFYDGQAILGTGTVVSGSVSISPFLLRTGSRQLRAYYSGDGAYAPATSNVLSQAVTSAAANMFVPVAVPNIAGSKSVATGDFNGDGRLDIVLGNVASTITVLLGNANGTFEAPSTYAAGTDGRSVAVGDFNGDGRADLAVTGTYNTVNVLLGTGDGSFQAPTSYTCGYYPYQVVVGDFNRDGTADLATANYLGGNVAVLLGRGDGTFQAAEPYAVRSYAASLAVGDFNGDGKGDLAVGCDANISVLLGNGDGSFKPRTDIYIPSYYSYNIYGIVASDLDGDGKTDLAIAESYNSSVSLVAVLPGRGDGTFGTMRSSSAVSSPYGIIAADLNGDGREDLATANYNGPNVSMFAGGSGSLAAINFPTPSSPYGLAAGDFNGDGRIDLAVANYQSYGSSPVGLTILTAANVSFMAVSGTPQSATAGTPFATPLRVRMVDSGGNPVPGISVTFSAIAGASGASVTPNIASATTDALGYASVTVTANRSAGSHQVVAAAGALTATFSLSNNLGLVASLSAAAGTPQYTPAGAAFPRPLQVRILDAGGNPLSGVTVSFTAPLSGASARFSSATAVSDASGLASISATANSTIGQYTVTASVGVLTAAFSLANQSGSSIALNVSSAASVLGAPVTLAATVNPSNATGRVMFYDDGTVVGGAVISSGAASFTTSLLPAGTRQLKAIYLGDPNFAVSASAVVLHPVSTLGGNVFTVKSLTSGSSPTEVVVGDFNRDGKPDLAVANASNTISILLGNGDGSFQAAVNYACSNPSMMVAADVNADGNPDLVVANSSPSAASVLLGNGDGSFQLPNKIASFSYAASAMRASDVNGDGRPDLVLAMSPGVVVLLGNGDGTVRSPVTSTLSYSANSVAAGDFNGDGKIDLVVGASGYYYVGILPGNGDGTFRAPLPNYNSSYGVSFVAAADFNSDGKLDVASNGAVSLGKGDGTLQSQLTFTSGDRLSVGDFDGDGRLDLAVTDSNAGMVRILLGLGNGRFQEWAGYAGAGSYIVAADFNRDGRTDLVVANGTNNTDNIRILLGASASLTIAGSPQTTVAGTPFPVPLQVTLRQGANALAGVPVTFSLPATGARATLSAATVATDASGVASVTATANTTLGNYSVVANAGSVNAVFLLNNGLGAPGSLTAVNTPQGTAIGTAFRMPLQVVVKDAGNNPLSGVTIGFTAPATGASAVLSSPTAVTDSAGIAFVTATANGVLGSYSVVANVSGLTAGFTLTNRAVSATALTVLPTTSLLGAPVTLTAAVSPPTATGSVTFWDGAAMLGSGTIANGAATLTTRLLPAGTRTLKARYVGSSITAGSESNAATANVTSVAGNIFRAATPVTLPSTSGSFAVGDFNNDGKADFAFTSSYGNSVSILLGKGDGTLQNPVTYSVSNGASAVAVGDFNGDGKPDLAVTGNSYSGYLTILAGNGDGTFATSGSYAVAGYPQALVAGDFNRDGRADIAIAHNSASSVSVLLGHGDGTFQPASFFDGGSSLSGIAAADFNLDGNADLITWYSGKIAVLPGNSDGTFQMAIPATWGGYLPVVGDFNGDGKPDVAGAEYSNLIIRSGNGDGTFQPAVRYPIADSNYGVAGDFNGDGRTDLAFGGASLRVMLGTGAGGFTAAGNHTLSSAYPVAVGDFNGDSKADIAINVDGRCQVLLGAFANLEISGSPQSTIAGTPFAAALQVTAREGANLLSGVPLWFTAPASGASAALSASTVTTNAFGVAGVFATANQQLGAYTVSASAGSLSASFSLTNSLGGVSTITPVNGVQSAAVGTAFAKPLKVTVRDAGGNPLAGATVTFTKPSTGAGATLSSATATTDSLGVASVTATANSVPGSYTVTASSGAATATFSLTNVSVSSATLTASPLSVRLGSAVTLTASVLPIAATGKVTFYDGATILGTSVLSSGTATFVTTLLPSGNRTLRAFYVGNSNYAGAGSSPVNVAVNAASSGTLIPGGSLSLELSQSSVAVGDFNADGFPDLAMGTNSRIATYLGNGDGTFQSPYTYTVDYGTNSIRVADLNMDGRADLVFFVSGNIVALFGNGNGTFQAARNLGLAGSKQFVVADFNGDGRPDIEFSSDSNTVVALGNGDGSFQPAVPSTLSGSPSYVVVGDFNRDGRLDIIATYNGTSFVPGNGDGSFQAPVAISSGDSSYGLLTADLNNDGKLDLIKSDYSSTKIQLGNGDGTFQAAIPYTGYPPPSGVGDFNGDGVVDLASTGSSSSSSSGQVLLMLGNGDGTFQTPARFAAGAYPDDLAVADLNGDGRTDLVVADSNSVKVPVLFGGTVAMVPSGTPQTASVEARFSTPLSVTVSDGAGHPMQGVAVLFAAQSSSSGAGASLSVSTAVTNSAGVASVIATANTVAGTYPVTATIGFATATFSLTNTPGPAAALNVVGGTPQSTPARLLFPAALQAKLTDSNGNPIAGATVTFSAPASGASATFSTTTAITNAAGIASVTATANGVPGAYSATATAGALTASFSLTNQAATPVSLTATPSPAVFGSPVTLTATVTPSTATGRVTFYDGVTVLGTVTLSSGRATLSTTLLPAGGRRLTAYYTGVGSDPAGKSNLVALTVNTAASPAFKSGANVAAGPGPTSVAAGDFNGDGRADLAVASEPYVSILLGNGDGTFRTAVSYSAGTYPSQIVAGDFNGDGRADLAVSNYLSNTVNVLLGRGDGSFQTAISYAVGAAPTSIAVGDFNNDGKPDLATANDSSKSVSVLLGRGDGTFQTAASYAVGGVFPRSVVTGDFNVDGNTDLATGDGGDSGIRVLLGNGNGTFQSPVVNTLSASYFPLSLAAFNADESGGTDLIAWDGAYLRYLRPTGNGYLTAWGSTYTSCSTYPGTLAVSDWNGDGRANDVACPATSGNLVRLFLGSGSYLFQSSATYAVGSGPTSMAIADFNGDSRPDLAVTNYSSNTVSILLGAVPALSVTKTHTGNFRQGQWNAAYSITVSNQSGAPSTSGTVTVTENPPAGLILASMSGTGWTCSGNSCTRSDQLAGGSSYPPITATVNVAGNAASPQVNSVTVSGGGSPAASVTDSTIVYAGPALGVSKTHTGNFAPGQSGATYTVTVNNAAGAFSTSGLVTVTENMPAGLTLVSMAGAGWTCPSGGNTCTRSDALAGGSSYPPITVTVNVGANAPVTVTNSVTVSGGGDPGGSHTATDVTNILPTGSGGTNLAQGKTATQSSAYAGTAAAAVDGNTDGNFAGGSVSHTNADAKAWWQVDLGASATVNSIVVWNRTDCCGNRLSDYWVFVSNTPFQAGDTPATLQGRAGTWSSHQTTAPSPATTIVAGGAQGRYVRVQLSGTDCLSLAEVQVIGSWVGSTGTNLAQGKAATQSSAYAGTAAAAVDGNTNGNFTGGSVSHTNADAKAWWQVDLGASATVNSIVVWNRTDCCGNRLSDYWVFVSNTPFQAGDTPATLQGRAGTWSSHQTTAPSPSTTIVAGGAQGRYVRVQLSGTDCLSLAEVQVIGSWVGSTGSNLAQGKTATQSSAYAGTAASAAVDGNTNGNFTGGSVSHTNADAKAWWQVDLGASATVNSIVVWNRTDCCGNRLSDYWVFVSNTPFQASDTPATLQGRAGTWSSHQTTAPSPSTTIEAGGAQGRYVRVQLSGTDCLSLAEVQVIGSWVGSTGTNLAQGKAAAQSSAYAGTASAAVDGNTNGNFTGGSVSHTNADAKAWWQVDLGASATVNSIVVWNRTDCCGNRLSDYWVFVSNTPFQAGDTPATLQGRAGTWSSHQTTAPSPSTTIVAGGAQGRYVRVQLSGTDCLSLAEVQVIGQ